MYSYNQIKHVVHSRCVRIPAPAKTLKSSEVGAGLTLADRPLQTVDGKKDPF